MDNKVEKEIGEQLLQLQKYGHGFEDGEVGIWSGLSGAVKGLLIGIMDEVCASLYQNRATELNSRGGGIVNFDAKATWSAEHGNWPALPGWKEYWECPRMREIARDT